MRRLDHIRSRSVTAGQLITKKMGRARHIKVSQGAMRFKLPVGYEHDADGRVKKSHDESVRAVVELVLQLFQELGSAYGVVKELRRRNVKVPRAGRRRGEPVRWVLPTRGMIHELLNNPAYAGAFAYYRTRIFQIRPGSDVPRPPRRLRNPDEWRVLRQNAHEGYISWEQYLANQKQLSTLSRKF